MANADRARVGRDREIEIPDRDDEAARRESVRDVCWSRSPPTRIAPRCTHTFFDERTPTKTLHVVLLPARSRADARIKAATCDL